MYNLIAGIIKNKFIILPLNGIIQYGPHATVIKFINSFTATCNSFAPAKMLKYGCPYKAFNRQPYFHSEIGNRGAYLSQKININYPEQAVSAFQVKIGGMPEGDLGVFERKMASILVHGSWFMVHGKTPFNYLPYAMNHEL
jgi:hypothetical protein